MIQPNGTMLRCDPKDRSLLINPLIYSSAPYSSISWEKKVIMLTMDVFVILCVGFFIRDVSVISVSKILIYYRFARAPDFFVSVIPNDNLNTWHLIFTKKSINRDQDGIITRGLCLKRQEEQSLSVDLIPIVSWIQLFSPNLR
jgi:hypothetical protein